MGTPQTVLVGFGESGHPVGNSIMSAFMFVSIFVAKIFVNVFIQFETLVSVCAFEEEYTTG